MQILDPIEKSNITKYIVFNVIYSIALTLLSGSVIQSFLEYLGQTDKTATYSSIVLIVQCLSMTVCSFWGDKIKKTTLFVALALGVISLIAIPLMMACIGVPFSNFTKYSLILIASCISAVGLGIYNILIYRLPLEVFDIKRYGSISAVCGLIAGVVCFCCTSLITYLVDFIEYKIVALIFFSIGFLLFIIAIIINLSLKPTKEREDEVVSEKTRLLKMGKFTKLIFPNFLRGVGQGVLTLVIVIGLHQGILNLKTSTVIATLTVVGSLLGNGLYLLMKKKLSSSSILIITSLVMAVFMPLMVTFNNVYIFFATYLISYLAYITYGSVIPVMVYDSVPSNAIGSYTAWRMLLLTFGNAVLGFFMNKMLIIFGTTATLCIGGISLLICGVSNVVVLGEKRQN